MYTEETFRDDKNGRSGMVDDDREFYVEFSVRRGCTEED